VIIGIEGGIGTGKTLTGVTLTLKDLYDGKKVYANVKFKNIPKNLMDKITYLTKDNMAKIFDHVKKGTWDMTNSTVFIQEAHNYMDSRNSQSQKNKILSYWILQSRHTGRGSCDIIFDTQELGQVDLRLRRNTDIILRPYISKGFMEFINKKEILIPTMITSIGQRKIRHKYTTFSFNLDVSVTREQYDTHEVVDF